MRNWSIGRKWPMLIMVATSPSAGLICGGKERKVESNVQLDPFMNFALYGGTFDPVHPGHVAVARAAARMFHLQRVYMVPAGIPPHKQERPIAAYEHRYAMLALATAGDKILVPSLLEAPEHLPEHGVNYSIDTVRRFKQTLNPGDRAFFLIGIDAFLEMPVGMNPRRCCKRRNLSWSAGRGSRWAIWAPPCPRVSVLRKGSTG